MYEVFKARAEGVSAQVHRFGGRPGALGFILEVLRKEGVTAEAGAHAAWANCRFLEGLGLADIARCASIRFDVTREVAANAKVGISQMDYAIADTGTLVQASSQVEQRLVSALPPAHVAILPSSRIVPDLPALLARLSPRDDRYLAFITGPSRTADIERVLTIGVHGPERLYVVCVDELWS